MVFALMMGSLTVSQRLARQRQIGGRRQGDSSRRQRQLAVAQRQQGRQSQAAAGRIAGNERGPGRCGAGRPVRDHPFVGANTILEPGGEAVLRRQPIVGEEDGTLGRRRDVCRQREIESARPRDKAAAVQIQQPQIGVRAGRQDPFTGNIADLHLDELDVLDGGLAARSHARPQRRQIEVVGAEGRVLAQFLQVFDALPRDFALHEFRHCRLGCGFGRLLAGCVGAPVTE